MAAVVLQQMPSDFHFEELEGVWRTEDEEVEIRPGCGVRMKVIGVDITPNMMVSRSGMPETDDMQGSLDRCSVC